MTAIRLLKLNLELNNTENWNELKHVIFGVIYFKQDRFKRNFGQPQSIRNRALVSPPGHQRPQATASGKL